MLSAIGSRTTIDVNPASSRRNVPDTFDTALTTAIARSAGALPDTASISAGAQSLAAKPAAPQFGTTYFDNLATMSAVDRNALVKKDADAISASQGLPSGQYNFWSLTSGQAEVIIYNLKII